MELGPGVLHGVAIKHAVHLGGLQEDLSFDLRRPQGRGCVRGHERVACDSGSLDWDLMCVGGGVSVVIDESPEVWVTSGEGEMMGGSGRGLGILNLLHRKGSTARQRDCDCNRGGSIGSIGE